MNYFIDLPSLESVLTYLEEKVPPEHRQLQLCQLLEKWGFTAEQARKNAETVFSKNTNGSARQAGVNGKRISAGKWVRGEQRGAVGGWLSTMEEHWQFKSDLTFVHKIIGSDLGISTGPAFNSSYANSRKKLEEGIWSPSDSTITEVSIFVLPYGAQPRTLNLSWVEVERFDYRACTIDGKRYHLER
ncbi:MAG: hypothetical protein Q7T57_02430 [Dehalococcoidales bacterium]|nr:hypothetical protein [Dehalococcoidales bacterium]